MVRFVQLYAAAAVMSCTRARARRARAGAALSLAQPTEVTVVLVVPLVTLCQLSREENAHGY